MSQVIRNTIIPALNTFCGVPIIEQDQTGDKPPYPHATFKITSPYIKDVGKAEETANQVGSSYQLSRKEQHKLSISFTAIDEEMEVSESLAVKIYDWFDFFGMDTLNVAGVVVTEKTGIQNRDLFLVDEYEHRNGFDVIVRVSKEITREIPYFDKVQINP